MDTLRAKQLQRQITKEAIALVSIGGTAADISQHEQSIRLVGVAWELPQQDSDALLSFVQQEKSVMQKAEQGEQVTHITLDGEDLLANWSGMETLEAVEDLFETSLHLDSYAKRQTMFDMAKTLMECQNFLDWIELTAAEKNMEVTVSEQPFLHGCHC